MKFTLKDGAVTRGLDGLQTLRLGQRRPSMPPERAYGEAGMPPFVPPNAYVIYDIEVVSRHASAEDALASMGPGGIGDGGEWSWGSWGGAPRTARALRSSSAGRATTGPTTPSSREASEPRHGRPGEEGLGVSEAMLSQAAEQLNFAETTNRTGRKKRKRRRMREERRHYTGFVHLLIISYHELLKQRAADSVAVVSGESGGKTGDIHHPSLPK